MPYNIVEKAFTIAICCKQFCFIFVLDFQYEVATAVLNRVKKSEALEDDADEALHK